MPIWKFTLNPNIIAKKEIVTITDTIYIRLFTKIVIEETVTISDNFSHFKNICRLNITENLKIKDNITLQDFVLTWLPITETPKQGYGNFSDYGDNYGFANILDIVGFRIEIWKTSTNTLLRYKDIELFELNDNFGTYVYSKQDNITDNGSLLTTGLTFKIYSLNVKGTYSLAKTVSV